MHAFEYHRPKTMKDAASLLRKIESARPLAGGQSLVPALRLRLARPAALIDLAALDELRGIRLDGGTLTIGALTRHSEVAASKDVAIGIPALARLAVAIGDRQVRNLGTLGGSLANNDPAADYPAAVLGLGATVTTNKREISADKFFTGLYETALRPGEVIVAVSFPLPKRASYAKFRNPASRFALVGVFVSESAGVVRVAVTGGGSGVFRVKPMEKRLTENFSPEAIAKVRVPHEDLSSDVHATAEYRAHMVTVMAQRAVAAAIAGK